MPVTGTYSATLINASVSGTNPIVQLKAASNYNCEVLRAWCGQSGSTTSAQQRIRISRLSAAATVTSFTPIVLTGAQAAKAVGSTSATGTAGSTSGTEGDVLVDDVFNVLNGWLYLPIPEERIIVPSGGILSLRFPTAPGSALTVTAGFIWQEIG